MIREMVIGLVALAVVFLPACEREDIARQEAVRPAAGTNPFVRPALSTSPPESGAAQAASETAGKQPRAAFEHTEFDFGEVEAGENVEHIYKFRNVGESVLIVEKVQSS